MTTDPVEIRIPALGVGMETALLLEWLKEPGDQVEKGDVVAVIETDKVTMDLEAPAAGRLGDHLFDIDDEVPVGEVLTVVHASGGAS